MNEMVVTPDLFEIPIVVDGDQHMVAPAGWPHSYARRWEREFRGSEIESLATAIRAAYVFGKLHQHHVAGLWWLHRLSTGEDVELDDVEFTYADYEATAFAQQRFIRERLAAAKARRVERERERGKATRRSRNVEKPTASTLS